MATLFEKLVDFFRPVDVRRTLAECRDDLRSEGFLPEADDVEALLQVGGDHYESENAIGAAVGRVIASVGDKVSAPLRRKLQLLQGVMPKIATGPVSDKVRWAALQDELYRLDRKLRDAGYAEASAAAYNAASRFDAEKGFSARVLADVVRALDAVLALPSLSSDLRRDADRVRRWAADPNRYLHR